MKYAAATSNRAGPATRPGQGGGLQTSVYTPITVTRRGAVSPVRVGAQRPRRLDPDNARHAIAPVHGRDVVAAPPRQDGDRVGHRPGHLGQRPSPSAGRVLVMVHCRNIERQRGVTSVVACGP